MNIFLGNLSVKQIEERTGILLSEADKAELSAMRQEKAERFQSNERPNRVWERQEAQKMNKEVNTYGKV